MAAVIEVIVMRLPIIPFTFHVVTVVILPAVNLIVCPPESHLKSLNVLFPEKLSVPIDALLSQKLLYVSHAPANVRAHVLDHDSFIVEVPAMSVKFVEDIFQQVPVFTALISHVHDPIVIVLYCTHVEVNVNAETLKLFALNVPCIVSPALTTRSS